MSNYTTIRDALTATLQGVTGIGVVHSRERLTTDLTRLKALFTAGGRINGWILQRLRTVVDRYPGEEVRTHTFRIMGFYSFTDDDDAAVASEPQFQDLIERICDAFRPQTTIGAVVTLAGPVTVAVIEPRTFAGVLVHYGELLLPVDEQAFIEP